MVVTIASIVVLAAGAISLLHWRLRGGRWMYLPDSREARIAFVLAVFSVPVLGVLMLLQIVGANLFLTVMAVSSFLDLSYAARRREREHRTIH